jgi:hypothetical protein
MIERYIKNFMIIGVKTNKCHIFEQIAFLSEA